MHKENQINTGRHLFKIRIKQKQHFKKETKREEVNQRILVDFHSSTRFLKNHTTP